MSGLIETGSIGDYLFGVVVLGSISAVLGKLLWKSLSVEGGKFDLHGAENVNEKKSDSLGNMYLAIAYIVIGVGGIILLRYDAVKGLLGFLGFLMGTTLLVSGLAIHISCRAVKNSIEYQLARSWYPRDRTIYIVISGIGGTTIYLAYKFLPSWKFVSPWDVAGLLFLILCSCIWVFLSDNSRSSGNSR